MKKLISFLLVVVLMASMTAAVFADTADYAASPAGPGEGSGISGIIIDGGPAVPGVVEVVDVVCAPAVPQSVQTGESVPYAYILGAAVFAVAAGWFVVKSRKAQAN